VRRSLRAILTVLALGVLLLVGVRERYDPRLSLYVRDLLLPTPKPIDVALRDGLGLRLYANTRPHVGKIASLQKGLVLVHQGSELIEEGYGFGVPIIEDDKVAYISRHARTALVPSDSGVTLVKMYRIDVADHPARFLRIKYRDVPPLGTVVFSYTVRTPNVIDVTVDFRDLEVDWERAYLMNEQGARSFSRYRYPSGREEHGDDIGIWRESVAPFGCWEDPSRRVGFCVDTSAGQVGFVGRERYNQYNWLGVYKLSWSGIDVQIGAPRETFTYTVRVQR
jgi:hypothetical protein